jgi:hypothetical protein
MSIEDFIQREKEVMEEFRDKIYKDIDELVNDILYSSTLFEKSVGHIEDKSYSVEYASQMPVRDRENIESMRRILKNFLHKLVDELFGGSSGDIL